MTTSTPLQSSSILAGLDIIEGHIAGLTTKEDVAAIGVRLAEMLESTRCIYRAMNAESRFATATVSEAVAPAAPVVQPSASAVADATYTVAVSDSVWYTVKIQTAGPDSKLAGKRIASFLTGPDNETDFNGFAFVNDDGTASIWRKAQTPGMAPWIDALNTIIGYPTMADEFRTAYAVKSGRCARCGRKLTVPASLNRGLGPECAKAI